MSERRDQDDITPDARRSGPDHRRVDPLVTVEVQRERDLFSGEMAERIFVKLYVAARESGLLAAISDRDWKTLCTLATYMDGDGYCHPSQAELAKAMGCSRQMANERIQSLAAFRFQGQQVLLVVKQRRSGRGEWARNGYRVLPISRLRIYDAAAPHTQSDTANDTTRETPPAVSTSLDTDDRREPAVSSPAVTAPLDTNENQRQPDFDLSKFEGFHDFREQTTRSEREAAAMDRLQATAGGDDRTVMTLGEILERRAAATDRSDPRPAPSAAVAAAKRRGGRVGSIEERELIAAYLRDWVAELGDESPLSSTVTRALTIFKQARVPQARWPDLLYQARALVREHTAQIRKQPANPGRGFAAKNRMPYYLAVLEDLAGLRPGPSDRSRRIDQAT